MELFDRQFNKKFNFGEEAWSCAENSMKTFAISFVEWGIEQLPSIEI